MIMIQIRFHTTVKIVPKPIAYHFHATIAVVHRIAVHRVRNSTKPFTSSNVLDIRKICGLKLALLTWHFGILSLDFLIQ